MFRNVIKILENGWGFIFTSTQSAFTHHTKYLDSIEIYNIHICNTVIGTQNI